MESFHVKLKRKEPDEVNDDFCDFSLSSPARKIRRLDAELFPTIEEEKMTNPLPVLVQDTFVEQLTSSQIPIDELKGSQPENQERAIILYDPMNNMPSLQTRSPFCISVNSEFLSGFKNSVLWSNGSDLLKSLDSKSEGHDERIESNNRNLAVVPWMQVRSEHQEKPQVKAFETESSEMMDSDDLEASSMDVEDSHMWQQIPVNQWQQHCMISQLPGNLSTPIAWSGTGV